MHSFSWHHAAAHLVGVAASRRSAACRASPLVAACGDMQRDAVFTACTWFLPSSTASRGLRRGNDHRHNTPDLTPRPNPVAGAHGVTAASPVARAHVSPAADFMAAGTAALISSVVLNPLELAKTRVQLRQRPGSYGAATAVPQGTARVSAPHAAVSMTQPTPAGTATSARGAVAAVQMQVPGAAASRPPVPTGLWSALRGIVRYEGAAALQHGLAPFSAFMLSVTAVKMGMYRPTQRAVEGVVAAAGGPDTSLGQQLSPGARVGVDVAAAMATGLAAGWVSNPFMLVKTHAQTRPAGSGPSESLARALWTIARGASAAGTQSAAAGQQQHVWQTLTQGGVQRLFAGSSACMLRVMLGNTSHLVSYDWAKRRLHGAIDDAAGAHTARLELAAVAGGTSGVAGAPATMAQRARAHGDRVLAGVTKDGKLVHLVSSLLATFCITTTVAPVDAVISRLHSRQAGAVVYRSAWHCATESVKREGALSLFRGWSGLYARIAPAAVGITMLWEQLRRAMSFVE